MSSWDPIIDWNAEALVAAKTGNLARLELAIAGNPKCVYATGEDKKTPLILATQGQHAGCVRALVKAGAPLWPSDGAFGAPFYAVSGGIECLKAMLEAKGEEEKWEEALRSAASCDYAASLRALILHGVNVNAQHERISSTALHAAYSSPECLKMLLAAGADFTRLNNDGETPLQRARWAVEIKELNEDRRNEIKACVAILEAAEKGVLPTREEAGLGRNPEEMTVLQRVEDQRAKEGGERGL